MTSVTANSQRGSDLAGATGRLLPPPYLLFGRHFTAQTAQTHVGASWQYAYHLIYAVHGTLQVRTSSQMNQRRSTLRHGQAIILPPGSTLSWRQGASFYHIAFLIGPAHYHFREHSQHPVLHSEQPQTQPSWLNHFGVPLHASVAQDFVDRHRLNFHKLATCQIADPCEHLKGHGLLAHVIADYLSLGQTEQSSDASINQERDEDLMLQFEMAIMKQALGQCSLRDIAQSFNRSLEHLSRIYKQRRGQTPRDFLNAHRMAVAQRLLRDDPQKPIAGIAKALGFQSAASFTRAFSKAVGMPPRQWIQQT